MLLKLVFVLSLLTVHSVASDLKIKNTGVFLYMDCPNDQNKRCAVFINKSAGANRGAFSNPEGILNEGESPEQGAVRVVIKELGHFLRFDVSDLERDFQSPANTGMIQLDNYSLFFKQIQSITAEKIALAIKNYSGTPHEDENLAVAIVPLKNVLDNLTKGTPIQVEFNNRRVYASLSKEGIPDTMEIQLNPRMVSLLKKNMDTNLQVNWLIWMMSTPRVSDIKAKQDVVRSLNNVDLDNQTSRYMRAIHEGMGVKYVPHRDTLVLREHAARNPSNLPYTASDAHIFLMMKDLIKTNPDKYPSDYMETTSMAKMVEDFLDDFSLNGVNFNPQNPIRITAGLRASVHKILETERAHKNMYVAYHAMKEENGIFVDLISAIRSKLMGRKVMNLGGVWDSKLQEMNFNTLTQFLELRMRESKNVQRRYPSPVDQRRYAFQYLKLGGNVLSANLALFGNNDSPLEYTFSYWITNHSQGGAGDLLNEVFRSLGIDESIANKRLDEIKRELVAKGIENTGGRLLQIFIDPDMIDKVAYVSSGNRPFDMDVQEQLDESTYRPSKMIHRIRENPEAVNNEFLALPYSLKRGDNIPDDDERTRPEVNWLQMRILPLPTETTKDYNVKVISYRSNPLTIEQEKIYLDKINDFADELLRPAWMGGLRGFISQGRTQQPKFMRQMRREYPHLIKEMADKQVLRGWIETEDSEQLLSYLRERPDDLNLNVDEYANIISYIVNHQKWQLLIDVLTNAPAVPLSNVSLWAIQSLFKKKLTDSDITGLFRGLLRFPIDDKLWLYLVESMGYEYLNVSNEKEMQIFGSGMIKQIVEEKKEFRNSIFQKLISVNYLPFLAFLLTNYPGDVNGQEILNSFLKTISDRIYSRSSSDEEVEQVALFIDSLELYMKDYSCNDVTLESNSKLGIRTPQAKAKLMEFLNKLDKQTYPKLHQMLSLKLNVLR
jgi:hypothetical protein